VVVYKYFQSVFQFCTVTSLSSGQFSDNTTFCFFLCCCCADSVAENGQTT